MIKKISLAQIKIDLGKPEENIKAGFEMIEQAANIGSDILLLPELWVSGYDLENASQYCQLNETILHDVKKLSDKHNLIIGGSYILAKSNATVNRFVLVLPGESTHPFYDKIHLFRQLDEAIYFTAGQDPVSINWQWVSAGLAICYDLRFPDLFRHYARQGANLMLIVAQWGMTRKEHWRTFLKSRAIENQAFVAAVNAVGPIRDKELAGCSAIISPWGEVLAEASPTEEALITAEIDFNDISRAKAAVPGLEDARWELYSRWAGADSSESPA